MKDNPRIDMTDAINKFYEEKNPERLGGNHQQFAYPVNDTLGLAIIGREGIDFDEDLGCIDANGNIVIPRNYNISMTYSEGLFATYDESLAGGYINTKGETVIPFKYNYVTPFKNGYAWVTTFYGEKQYINKKGRPLIRIITPVSIKNYIVSTIEDAMERAEEKEREEEKTLKLSKDKHKTK